MSTGQIPGMKEFTTASEAERVAENTAILFLYCIFWGKGRKIMPYGLLKQEN